MATFSRHFTFSTDNPFGYDGWLPDNMMATVSEDDLFPCAMGPSFAHDIVEHREAPDEGGVRSEIEAVGAVIAGRFERHTDRERFDILSAELYSIAELAIGSTLDAPDVEPHGLGSAAIRRAIRDLIADNPDAAGWLFRNRHAAARWLTVGAESIAARYGSAERARIIFRAVERLFTHHIGTEFADWYRWEGMSIRVNVDTDRLVCSVESVCPDCAEYHPGEIGSPCEPCFGNLIDDDE